MPVIVLAGDEEFEVERRLQALKEELLDPVWASVNLVRADNPALDKIDDLAAQLPFGPGNRVIIIDRCDLFTKKRGKSPKPAIQDNKSTAVSEKSKRPAKDSAAAALESFEQALGKVAENTFLIFNCPHNFDSTLKTSKAISKHAQIEQYAKERYFVGSKNARLENWCRKEAKRFAATIDDAAIYYLLDGSEADLRQISQEIKKAAIYILPKTHITLSTLEAITPFHSHIFAFADKWISGRRAEAQASLEELLLRQSAIPTIAALQTMLSKWIHLKALCEKLNDDLPGGPGIMRRELSLVEAARKISTETGALPMVIEKDLKRLVHESSQSLIDKKIELTRLEALVKTGDLPDSHALSILLTK